jgi:hypothetical protein
LPLSKQNAASPAAQQATALVVSSERARDILHLILSLAPLTSKHAIFSTAEEAAAWLATV